MNKLPHRTKTILLATMGLILFSVAVIVLIRMLHGISPKQFLIDLQAIPPLRLFLAAGVTLLTYFIMSGYDLLGIRYAGGKLPKRRVIAAAFIGDAFNNCLGLSAILGSSVRYRFYRSWGLTTAQIAKTIGIFTISYWMGFTLLAGTLLIMGQKLSGGLLPIPSLWARVLGILLLSVGIAYTLLMVIRQRPLKLIKWHIEVPSGRLALGLLTVAILDWLLSATVFYLLLPAGIHAAYAGVIVVYVIAHVGGMISQLPGGIVVFEVVSLSTLASLMPASQIAVTLVAFRAIFYLFPLLLALALMAILEILHIGGAFKPVVVPPFDSLNPN